MSLTKACGEFGCGNTKPCATHTKKKESKRKTTAERGYGGRWQLYRVTWLAKYPICGDRIDGSSSQHSICVAEQRATNRGTMCVDHIVPHTGPNDPLFWDARNHQTLCEPCHNRKTATEDGGFLKRGLHGQRVVITGPPGSGKTTWVEQRARPGDIVFDLDVIAAVVTRVPRWPRPPDATKALLAMRDGLVTWLEQAPTLTNVYVIVTDASEAERIAKRIRARLNVKGGGGCTL